MERLQKYLAECGVASRRACEQLIAAGRVSVNGAVVTRPGSSVEAGADRVEVDGRPVRPEDRVYLAVHKPPGFLCTSRDPQGRPTVMDLLDRGPHPDVRLYTVGRLDGDSEGLLLVTNDGAFANLLTHPRHHVAKTYLVRTAAALSPRQLKQLRAGVVSDGEALRLLSVSPRAGQQGEHVYRVVLGEGRKRHLRRMFRGVGARVERLQRTAIGPLRLGGLEKGTWRPLSAREIGLLRRAAAPRA